MAQLIVAAAGAAIGGMLAPGIVAFGMTGASIGWMAGSMLGSAFAPTQKGQGPRLDDLKVSSSSYGTPIPYLAGHPRVAGQIVWASAKREIATTEEVGKGGGGSEYTTYTYEVDLLYLLSDNEIPGVARVWNNGELVFDGMVSNNAWSRLTAYSGASDQLPDPDYEAAVGTANAPAYRGRGSVFIKSLQLGGSGQIPNLTFEIGVSSSYENSVLLYVTGEDAADHSRYARPINFVQSTDSYNSTAGLAIAVTSVPGAFGGNAISFHRDNTSYYEVDFNGWFPATDDVSFEFRFQLTNWEAASEYSSVNTGLFLCFSDGAGARSYHCNIRPSPSLLNIFLLGYSGARIDTSWQHAVAQRVSGQWYFGINGVWVATSSSFPISDKKLQFGNFYFQTGLQVTGAVSGAVEEVKVMTGVNYPYTSLGGAYTVPAGPMSFGAYAVTNSDVVTVVSDLCNLSGLSSVQFDAAPLSAVTKPVRAMAIGQVSSARTVLEMLSAAYHFDCVLSDKLYFRPRASASAATLTFDEFGVAVDSNTSADPLPLMMANELEIPAQLAVTFSNVDGDYQTDTQYSDRLLTGQESTSATVLPLGFTASEGKQIADALLLDKAVSALTTTVSVNVSRTKLEPTDVVTLTADDGSTFRMRVTNKKESNGVITLGCVADDSTVFTQAGVTAGGTASQTVVLPTPSTDFALLDIPLLRDADNLPGFYVAVEGSAANWSNCAVYTSLDDLTYSLVTTMADQTAIGTCTTTLGNWTGGAVFDETNTVTVDIGELPQLASVTRDDILTNQAVNAALIGNELVQYRTATLVSAGVYTLSGLLRGRRGTEWASTGHAATERFVVLGTSGMRHIALQSGDLGSARYYKVVSAGQRLSAVTAQAITPAGVALECFSPVNARANRDTTDTVLTWTRRTRLSTRLTGTLPISAPLGETTESYEVEVWDATYATLKRTLTASTPTVTYTSAQQVTDFGSDQTVLYLKIYQLSATVGRGYPLTVSI